MGKNIFAAGTLPWRRVTNDDGTKTVEILLVYRKKYKDWSFPKGKLDKGETMPQAAVRETLEEVELDLSLGVNLGTVSYTMRNGDKKVVQYWAAKVPKKTWQSYDFKCNSEIEKIKWCDVEKAHKKLTYKRDREILEVFNNLLEHDKLDTFPIVILRHAKAEPRSEEYPRDRDRPLADKGFGQAQMLIPTLTAYGAKQIITSDAERCRTTIDPLATRHKIPVKLSPGISQDHWETGDLTDLRDVIDSALVRGKSTVICSHLPVLFDIAREIAIRTNSTPGRYIDDASALPPAGFSVFHISKKHPFRGIVSVEVYPLKHGKKL